MDCEISWRIKVGYRDERRGGFRIDGGNCKPAFRMPLAETPMGAVATGEE